MEKILEKSESQQYSQFLSVLSTLDKIEDKVRHTLDFMHQILSSEKTPTFRDFWEAKRLCLDFFKEKIAPHVRTSLWAKYVELSDAMRHVKQLLDEQSSFSEEQIALALDALEKDVQNVESVLAEMGGVELPEESQFLQKNGPRYTAMQKELDLYNTFSGRLNGLRKELIQTPMRIRTKNRLFERLSKLGDLVFPKRKEGIKTLSELFFSDVERFINQFECSKGPYFALKDEIRALQKFAKTLSINPSTFNQTRERLSGCWDQIKDKEAAHREQRAEQKERFKESFDQLSPKIEDFKTRCAEYQISLSAAEQEINALFSEMKDLHFGHEEMKGIKKQLFEAKALLEEKEKELQKKKKTAEEFEQKKQVQAYGALLVNIQEVLDQAEALSQSALVEKLEIFLNEGRPLKISSIEKAVLENRLDTIADYIEEKKLRSLLQESPDDLASSLHVLVNQRHKEKRKIKEALEAHRKLVGGSSLNLEQSMQVQELIKEERLRLDTIEIMVEEIEEKLFDLEE